MVPHLIIDAIRRKWRVSAFSVFQVYILMKFLGDVWPSTAGMASTLSAAWFLTIGAGSAFQSREFFQLPVTRRQWWLARWWLSVTAPVVLAHVGFTFAQGLDKSQWPSVEQTVLFMIFGVLYCGCGMAVQSTAIGRAGDEPYQPFTLQSTGWVFLIIFALNAVPFIVARYLPHSFADIGPAWIVIMLVMAALTVVGYRHTPEILPRPDMRLKRRLAQVPSAPAAAAGARPTMAPPKGYFARLTGSRLVMWEECKKQFWIIVWVLVAGVVAWAVTSLFRPVLPLAEIFRNAGALPFSSARAPVVEPIIFSMLLVVLGLAEGWMASKIRLLRTLPLSTTQLGAIPAGLGLISASMLGVVLLILHALVVRTWPVSLRPDLFVAFAGLAAATHTIRFIVGTTSSTGWKMISFVPVMLAFLSVGFIDSWKPAPIQAGMLIGGVLMLAATWGVMRSTLRVNSAMYRQRLTGVPS